MNRLKVFLVFLYTFVFVSTASYAETDRMELGNGLVAEPIVSITPFDLWHSASEIIFRSTDGFVVGFWPADTESAERRGGLIALGIVLVGFGNAAEIPVALKLWSSDQLVFAKTESDSYGDRNNRPALFFYQNGCLDVDRRSCKLAAIVITTEDNAVLINGKLAGTIEDP